MKSVRRLLEGMSLALLLCIAPAHAKTPTAPKTAPEINAAFSKAAIKALLTIERTSDRSLIDAALIDEHAEESGLNEQAIGFHIELFRFAKHEGQELTELGADPGVYSEDNESKCVAAWLPKLRALSKEIPKACDILWSEGMKAQNSESAK